MKTYHIIIANEASNYTSTKYNNTLTGFTSEEAASNAAKEALRDAAGEINKGAKVFYSEALNAWVLANNGNWLLVAKIEATETEQHETKQITVKRSDWNETAKRLECAGWHYIGTPTATGKTIYRRDNSELEIIIEEEPNNTPATMNANETIPNTPANLAKLRTLAVNGTPMFYIWLDAVDDAATTSVYLTEDAARADIARLEADDREAGIYEPDAYRIINATPYFA